MKKNLSLLFALLCAVTFFTACSDDDDTSYKTLSGDYSTEKLDLTYNGKALNGKTISMSALNGETGIIILKDIVPGEASLTVENVKLENLGNGNFSFDGQNANADRTVAVSGKVEGGKMTLATVFKVTSKVVGKWMLLPIDSEEQDPTKVKFPLILNIDTDIESMALPIMMGPNADIPWEIPMKYDPDYGTSFTLTIQALFSMIVPGLLESIDLKEDGNLIATYKPFSMTMADDAENAPLTTPEGMVRYYVKDGYIYVLLDIASLMSTQTRADMDINTILSMLNNGIPLKLDVTDAELKAYVDKDMMLPFMSMADLLKGMISNMEPIDAFIGKITAESLTKFIDDAVVLVTTAKSMEIGLDLVPYVAQQPSSRGLKNFIERSARY